MHFNGYMLCSLVYYKLIHSPTTTVVVVVIVVVVATVAVVEALVVVVAEAEVIISDVMLGEVSSWSSSVVGFIVDVSSSPLPVVGFSVEASSVGFIVEASSVGFIVVLSSSSPSGTGHALPHFTTMSTLSLRAFAQSMNASLHIFCLSTCAFSTSSTFSHAVSAAFFKASTSPNIAHILSASALVIARKPVLNASAASLHPVIFVIVSLSMPPSQAVSMAALQAFSFVKVSLKFVPFPESLLWQSPLTPSTSAKTPSKSAFFSFFFFVMPDLSKALADIRKIFLALFPYHHPNTDIFSRHSSVTAQAASCLPLILLL